MTADDDDRVPRPLTFFAERGAFMAVGFPLASAVLLSRAAPAALLFAAATVLVALVGEPLMVLTGHRGEAVRNEHGARAQRRVIAFGALAVISGLVAVGTAPQEASLWLFVPIVAAVSTLPRIFGGTVQTLPGELLAGVALTTMVVPIGLAGGIAALPLVVCAAAAWALTNAVGKLAIAAMVRPHARRSAGDQRRAEEGPPESTTPGSLRGRLDRSPSRTVLVLLSAWALIGAVAVLVWVRIPIWAGLSLWPAAVAGLYVGVMKISATRLPQVGWSLVGVRALTFVLLAVASFTAVL